MSLSHRFFPSEFIKASELSQKVTPVTIVEAVEERVGPQKELKLVLVLRGVTPSKLILNRTNMDALEDLFGSNLTTWKGQKIVLAVMKVSYQGKTVPGVRIEEAAQGPLDVPADDGEAPETDAEVAPF